MKASQTSLLTGCAIALLTCFAFAEETAKSRLWTDLKGRQVDAVFVALDGDNVIIQTADGSLHRIPMAGLAPADQEMAKTSKPMEGAILPANAPAPIAAKKIDQLVALGLLKQNAIHSKEGKPQIKTNPMATDEQFVRRIYLDITGRIPSYEETRAFLNSRNPTKRKELINHLLDSDGFVSHTFNYFADMLRMKDQLDNRLLKGSPYIKWLKDNITANTGWDKMSYELMTATGKLWNNGATGYLLRDAGMPLDNLSTTLSIFLGTDVACAQCHDHPFADWTQIQFYQMASFFGTTSTKMNARDFGGKDPTKQLTKDMEYLMEKNGMDAKKNMNLVSNVLRANEVVVRDLNENRTKLPHDYKYKDAAPNDPVAPKFVTWAKDDEKAPCYNQDLKSGENLRASFGKWMTDPTNPRFAMTIANRLWARAMGVGLTASITNIDDPDRASNPELLKHLASEMVRLKFNMKEFQRIIYNTQTYQREATTYEVAMGEPYYFPGPLLRRMTAEQAWDSYMTLVLGEQLDKIKNDQADPYGRAIDMDLEKSTVQTLASKITAIQNLGNLAKKNLASGGLAKAGTMAPDDDDEMDAAKVYQYGGMKLMRASELEQPAPAGHFLREFGQSDRHLADGSAKDGSVPQVLVMMNGKAQQMMTDKDSLMFRNIAKNKSAPDKMEAVFLSILNRRPTMKEKQVLLKDQQKSGEKSYANVIWALINSREFTFIQ